MLVFSLKSFVSVTDSGNVAPKTLFILMPAFLANSSMVKVSPNSSVNFVLLDLFVPDQKLKNEHCYLVLFRENQQITSRNLRPTKLSKGIGKMKRLVRGKIKI